MERTGIIHAQLHVPMLFQVSHEHEVVIHVDCQLCSLTALESSFADIDVVDLVPSSKVFVL